MRLMAGLRSFVASLLLPFVVAAPGLAGDLALGTAAQFVSDPA